ncbi:hypothetical protein SUGI_0701620 [Cryptomeria japonica]|nr:hypothetical protein SUGI_0701620 [Cryptomeria japonica]
MLVVLRGLDSPLSRCTSPFCALVICNVWFWSGRWPLVLATPFPDCGCEGDLIGVCNVFIGVRTFKIYCVDKGEDYVSSHSAAASYASPFPSPGFITSTLIVWVVFWALRGYTVFLMICMDLIYFEASPVIWFPPKLVGSILSMLFAARGRSLLKDGQTRIGFTLFYGSWVSLSSFSLCGALQLLWLSFPHSCLRADCWAWLRFGSSSFLCLSWPVLLR